MDDPGLRPANGLTDLELEILDLLREDTRSADLLAETLSHEGNQVGAEEVRSGLHGLASLGLVRALGAPHPEARGDRLTASEATSEAERWEITEEGQAVVEPHLGVARAPYDRDVGNDQDDDDDRDVAGLVVLLLIALVTGVCAAYTLLTVTGVLGGG